MRPEQPSSGNQQTYQQVCKTRKTQRRGALTRLLRAVALKEGGGLRLSETDYNIGFEGVHFERCSDNSVSKKRKNKAKTRRPVRQASKHRPLMRTMRTLASRRGSELTSWQ